MGKGRDKRKKHEDPGKAAARLAKQAAKLAKSEAKAERTGNSAMVDGFNGEESVEVTLKRIQKAENKRKNVNEIENCPAPNPRANCAVHPHPTRDNELVLFGGELWNGEVTEAYNDLYIYNTVHNQWRQVIAPAPPSPRSSVQVIAYKQYLIFQGGEYVSQSQSQFMHFRDAFRFDTNTCLWEEMKYKNGPSSRSGHRMALWKRSAVLFAGFYDNAIETKYYNDLWVLSDLEGNGTWQQITFPAHAEMPEPRSGHAMGIYENKLFVYGGYSTQKFNRFKKSEATVHHDLWTVDLAAATPMWTKIKLAGIPPPIRSGVSATFKDKRLLLFGGVVDIDAPGGKTMSAFHNDLFVFHMDTQRFFPMVLQNKKQMGKKQQHADPQAGKGDDLQTQLAQLGVAGSDSSDDDEADDDDMFSRLMVPGARSANAGFRTTTTSMLKEGAYERRKQAEAEAAAGGGGGGPALTAANLSAATGEAPTPKTSSETNAAGQTLPCPRMDPQLCVKGNTFYVVGGQFEVGKKEITLMDVFSLNLNKMDGYEPLVVQDLEKVKWVGKESEPSDRSWETGSTALSMTSEIERMHELEDEEDEEMEEEVAAPAATSGAQDEDEDEDEDAVPTLVPKDIDSRTTVKGKKGIKQHKAQLEAQLGAQALIPTPTLGESIKDFYHRTEQFWQRSALDALGGPASEGAPVPAKMKKKLREDAMLFCRLRYEEAIELLEQLRDIEERQKAEDEALREMLREKRARQAAEAEAEAKAWEEEEAAEKAAAAAAAEKEADTE